MATNKTKKKVFKLGKNQLKWVKALESGKYRQTDGCLRNSKGFCCLGLLEKLEGNLAKRKLGENAYLINEELNDGNLSRATTKKYGFRNQSGEFKKSFQTEEVYASSLVNLNDSLGYSFKKIAKYIRENPSNVFKKSY